MGNLKENFDSETKFAVVTGASTGIGFELAKQFANHGYDLLVVSRSDKLKSATAELKKTGVRVLSLQVDLRTETGVDILYSKIRSVGRPVDAIALNAGIGLGGASFDKSDLKMEIDIVNLNIRSVVHLTKLVLKDMVKRGHGKFFLRRQLRQ